MCHLLRHARHFVSQKVGRYLHGRDTVPLLPELCGRVPRLPCGYAIDLLFMRKRRRKGGCSETRWGSTLKS